MALLNVTNIAAALKDYYLEGLRTQINTEADPLWSELEKSTRLVSGEQIKMSIRYGRSGGIGARADDGDLPAANARKSVKATISPKNLFARMQLTERAIKASAQDAGAFVSQLEQVLDDLQVDARDDIQRQAYSDGTGKIATLAASPTSATTLTLNTVVGLAEGMLIDVLRGDTNASLHAGVEITLVDDDNNQIVVGTAITADHTRSDYVTRAGSYNLEMTGMSSVFAQTGNIYGLARSSYTFLKATRLVVSGDLSEVKIQEGLDRAFNRTGVKHDFLIGSHGVRRGWQNLKSAERSAVNTVELKGGFKAPTYENDGRQIPFIAAKYAPSGTLRAISRQNFEVAWMGDWEFMDKDGAVLSRVANKNAYEATLELFADIVCDVIRGQVEWASVTEY